MKVKLTESKVRKLIVNLTLGFLCIGLTACGAQRPSISSGQPTQNTQHLNVNTQPSTENYPQDLERRSGKFVKGKTSYSEILAELGKPGWEGVLPNGKKSVAYVDGNGRSKTIVRVQFVFDEKDLFESKMLAKLNFK